MQTGFGSICRDDPCWFHCDRTDKPIPEKLLPNISADLWIISGPQLKELEQLKSGTCKDTWLLCIPLQAVRRVSTALSVLKCVAVRTGRTVTTSADSVPAERASSDRAVSSVSVCTPTSVHQHVVVVVVVK